MDGMTIERRDGVVVITMSEESAQRLARMLTRYGELVSAVFGKVTIGG